MATARRTPDIGDMVMLDDASMSNISRSGSTTCCWCFRRSRSKYHKHFWPVVNVTAGLCPADKIKLEHQFIPYVAKLENSAISARSRAGWARHAIVFVGILLITIISLRDTERIQASDTMEEMMFWLAILTTMSSTALGNMTRDLQLFEKATLLMLSSTFLQTLGNSLVNLTGPYAGFASVGAALPTFWFHVESLKNAVKIEESKILQGKGQEEGMRTRVMNSMKSDTSLLPPQGFKGTTEDPLSALYTAMNKPEEQDGGDRGVTMDRDVVTKLGSEFSAQVKQAQRASQSAFLRMRHDLLNSLQEGGALTAVARKAIETGGYSAIPTRDSDHDDGDTPDFLANAIDALHVREDMGAAASSPVADAADGVAEAATSASQDLTEALGGAGGRETSAVDSAEVHVHIGSEKATEDEGVTESPTSSGAGDEESKE